MRIKSKIATTVIVAGLVVAAGSVGAASASASTPQPLAAQNVDGVTVKGAPKLNSEAALETYIAENSTTVVADAATGATISVTAGNSQGVSALIAERSPCGAGDAFWEPVTPFAQVCFYGSAGSLTISARSNVKTWHTGSYTARGGWLFNGITRHYTLKQAPNSTTTLSGGSAQADFGQIY